MTIYPTTCLYTFTADFAGYTLLDSILGDMSAKTFMWNYEGDEKEAANMIAWIAPMAERGEGFWLTEEEAEAFAEEAREQGSRITGEVTCFTIAQILDEIKEAAEG